MKTGFFHRAWLFALLAVPHAHGNEPFPVLQSLWPGVSMNQKVTVVSTPTDLVLSESLAFIIGRVPAVHVLDLALAEAPRVALPFVDPKIVVKSGTTTVRGAVYLATSSGVWRVSTFPPFVPEPILPQPVLSLAVGDTAAAAIGYDGLITWDPRQPAKAITSGLVRTRASYVYHGAVSLVGHYAVVVDNRAGLEVIDLRQPEKPRSVGFMEFPGWFAGRAMASAGNMVAVAGSAGQLEFVDLTMPAEPKSIASFTGASIAEVAAFGEYFLVADQGRLRVFHASSPSTVELVSTRALGDSVPVAVAADAERAIVLDALGLHVFDWRDQLSSIQLLRHNTSATEFFIDRLALADGLLLAGNRPKNQPGFLYFFRPNELAKLQGLASQAYQSEAPNDIASTAEVAYLAEGASGLRLVDLGDPTFRTLSRLAVGGKVNCLAREGSLVALAGETDLVVVDVAVPAVPKLLGRAAGVTTAKRITLSEGRAYVADARGLQIFDLRDGANPRLLGGFPLADGAQSVALAGRYALVATGQSARLLDPDLGMTGMVILDLANPAQPKQVGRHLIAQTETVASVVVRGDRAYLARGEAGLEILDISNVAAPRRVAFNRVAPAYDLLVSEDQLYLAAGAKGVAVFSLRPPNFGLSFEETSGGQWLLTLEGEPGLEAWLQQSDNLRNWSFWKKVRFEKDRMYLLENKPARLPEALYFRLVRP